MGREEGGESKRKPGEQRKRRSIAVDAHVNIVNLVAGQIFRPDDSDCQTQRISRAVTGLVRETIIATRVHFDVT
jgi:hypothetical protein